MDNNVTHIREVAERIRRVTTNREILELCDYVRLSTSGCKICESARLANRERQRRFRNANRDGLTSPGG